jgi:thiol-disulfide isomerase/thioredoxin
MRSRPALLIARSITCPGNATRAFSSSPRVLAKNRIYPNRIRREDELQTLTLMSASSRVPLITFWMATWCQNCKIVLPLIQELIEKDKVGEAQGGVSFVEVEMDSPDMGGLAGTAMTYGINSIPTLLAFDRQEAQRETKISRLDDLKNREFLIRWIEKEASRRGEGGAGGSFFGLFGR